jgi:hypothetical protein
VVGYQQVLRRIAELALLAILVVAIILALAGASHATVSPVSISVASDTQWQSWALRWHRAAHTQRAALLRHTDALGLSAPFAVPTMGDSWQEFGTACRARARTQKARTGRLHKRITHPPGPASGAKWASLARFVGWPESAIPHLCSIVTRESSGRTTATSSANCRGLTQLHGGWWTGTWAIRGKHRAFNPYDPEANLRAALGIWRDQGRSFLPAWALTS